jgi:hypothetical protein
MFGSLVFLIGGHIAVAVRADELLVRTGEEVPEEPGVRAAVMGTRRMKGWVTVDAEHPHLDDWIARGTAHARSLPPK